MKRILLVILSTLTLFTTLSVTPIANAADSLVVGVWGSANGEVTVTGTEGSYEGIVTQEITFAECVHKKGEVIWKILGNGSGSVETSGIAFMGSFQGYVNPPDCLSSLATADFKITRSGNTLTLTACPAWSGPCQTLTKSYTPPDIKAPTITFVEDATITPLGQLIHTVYYVKDDSGRASVRVRLFSDGAYVYPDSTKAMSVISGDPNMYTFQPVTNQKGPFYICIVATDASENSSGEFSNCRWRSIEVPIDNIANGCGAQKGGWLGTKIQNVLIDTMYFPKTAKKADPRKTPNEFYKINVRAACNNHDAGYQGSTIKDQVSGKYVDTRSMTRAQVDEKFRTDIIILCKKANLPKTMNDICVGGPTFSLLKLPLYASGSTLMGAKTYSTAVAKLAWNGYDANSTSPGVQNLVPQSTKPTGGIRYIGVKPKIFS